LVCMTFSLEHHVLLDMDMDKDGLLCGGLWWRGEGGKSGSGLAYTFICIIASNVRLQSDRLSNHVNRLLLKSREQEQVTRWTG